jgi:hypothetical protein
MNVQPEFDFSRRYPDHAGYKAAEMARDLSP